MSYEIQNGEVWGFMEEGAFVPLPMKPMELAKLGPPPFTVTLPLVGERHIVRAPA